MKSLLPFFLLLFVFTLLKAQDATIRIGGSDLFDPLFEEIIREYAGEREIEIDLDLGGSYGARKAIQNGELDIALLAATEEAVPETGDTLTFPFAYQTVVFGVSSEGAIDQLSLSEIRGIFGSDESSSMTRWGDVGASGPGAVRSIALYSISSQEGLALSLFLNTVLNTPRMRSNISYSDSFPQLLNRLQNDSSGIALLPRPPPPGNSLRILSLASTDEDFAFGPTPENIHNGDYPIRLPITLFVSAGSGKDLGPILDFLVSNEVAEQIEASGLVPLPSNVRNRLRFEFERL